MFDNSSDYVEMPIDGTLDLHTFKPDEVKQLIPDYIEACLEKKIFQIRIIHGKGKGVLRRIVHSILDNHPAVQAYRHESGSGGSWGATVVDLKET
jgi:DNA-nicking Smr family endonuclease